MSSGKLINIGAFHAHDHLAGQEFDGEWVINVEKDHLLSVHEHWEPELRAILEVTTTRSLSSAISRLLTDRSY